jgi:hypothetical protein
MVKAGMCLECEKKMLAIDVKVPHFIDRYVGNFHGVLASEALFATGQKELWDYMTEKHGKIVAI